MQSEKHAVFFTLPKNIRPGAYNNYGDKRQSILAVCPSEYIVYRPLCIDCRPKFIV